ncbi:MAG: ABC transporter permease [Acidimicrobiales bacterium]|nr:ABC transporter permease [Acidimicrobiales bacterium]MYG87115.1 ABC transporter permease [Acidimicrobiales bacterium]MYI27077.1 ABC transporter permease [Acidimicrobiales bacterium]
MALAENELAERPLAAAWRRFAGRRVPVVALVALVIIGAAVAGADLIAPYQSGQQHLDHVLAPPGGDFLLGTDTLGRDTLSQTLYAGRISLVIGMSVALIASLLGTTVGVVAGYLGGRIDAVLMRFTDTLLALPLLMMIILLARILGDSAADVVLVLSLLGWMALARIIRAKTLALREQEFVAAARSMGASTTRIMVRHLLPNLVGEITVAVSLAVAGAILAESVLSFLGLGVSSAHTPTWGNMIGGNEGFMTVEPWLVWAPGIAIVVTVLCVNFIGDGLRDAFDVRSDGRD